MSLSTLLINPSEYKITHKTDDLTNEEYKNDIIKTTNSIFDIATEKRNNFVNTYNSQNDIFLRPLMK